MDEALEEDSDEILVPEVTIEAEPLPKEKRSPWADYPNKCETFTAYMGKGGARYKRNRYKWTKKDRIRTRNIVRLVAREMGANPDLVGMVALHESTWNPHAIHILNPDLEANQKARKQWAYHSTTAKQLEAIIAHSDAKSKKWWKASHALKRMETYKDNEFWNDQLQYDVVVPPRTIDGIAYEGTKHSEYRSVWSYGYGLGGMNAILFTQKWDPEAPPWILCGDDGIISSVLIVWSLRKAQSDCETMTQRDPETYGTDAGNYRGVLRRFARGHCGTARLGKVWRGLMGRSKIDWEARAKLGRKWKASKTDRMEILEHMRAKVEEAGFAPETPPERRDPKTAPVIVKR